VITSLGMITDDREGDRAGWSAFLRVGCWLVWAGAGWRC
jgi:hypothetical protein